MFFVLFFFFFFFQAEDGIRDRTVTGVQTCALPICHSFELGSRIFATLFLSITSVPSRAGAPVPSKILPLRRTSVPSGPRGPGFTTVRRGSSLTGVFGSRNFLRSCAFSCVQLCEPKSKRKTIRPSAFVFILPSSTDEFLSQFHAFWAAQRELRAARWSRATRNLFQIFFIPALYFGASSFFSASANSLDHSPNAFSISSW